MRPSVLAHSDGRHWADGCRRRPGGSFAYDPWCNRPFGYVASGRRPARNARRPPADERPEAFKDLPGCSADGEDALHPQSGVARHGADVVVAGLLLEDDG